MRKIINGLLYDTETAKKVGSVEIRRHDEYNVERIITLYKTSNNRYFFYSIPDGDEFSKHCYIRASNEEEARAWAEMNLTVDEYIAIFGEAEMA